MDIILRVGEPDPIEEVLFSRSFCRRYLKVFCDGARRIVQRPPEALVTVGDLRALTQARIVFLINEDELLVTPHIFRMIPERLHQDSWWALAPALSPARYPAQQAPLLYPYHTVRTLLETADILAASRPATPRTIEGAAEWTCVFFLTSALHSLSTDTPLDTLWPQWAAQGRLGIVDACFVHRFGFVHQSPREDLLRLIPDHAASVLDVGCAYGALGRHIKKLRPCYVAGIERNGHMARAAAAHYDAVWVGSVEDVRWNRRFDAVICGDVLEHLVHPSAVLRRLGDALTDDGVLIASVPNTGHWSVVMDLALGRFETVPAGLLCSSHLRFFTEKELLLLLEESSWAVEQLERDQSLPTPAGARFIEALVSAGLGDEVSLRTERFRLRARKKKKTTGAGS